MKKNVKYFISLGLIGIVFIAFLSPFFSYTVTQPVFMTTNYTGYQVLNNNVIDIVPTVFLDISVALLIVFGIFDIVGLFIKGTNRPLYYTGLVIFTLSFVCMATAGFINQNIAWGFYVAEGTMAVLLLFTLSYELIAVKGF
jgi:hypothetical protein